MNKNNFVQQPFINTYTILKWQIFIVIYSQVLNHLNGLLSNRFIFLYEILSFVLLAVMAAQKLYKIFILLFFYSIMAYNRLIRKGKQ